jgi:hypothetical protein
MWSEAVTILGGFVGICVGSLVAFMLVKVLAGVFDPPPEFFSVPWIYLLLLCSTAVSLAAAGVVLHLRKLHIFFEDSLVQPQVYKEFSPLMTRPAASCEGGCPFENLGRRG